MAARSWRARRFAPDTPRRGLDVSIIRPRTIMGHGRLGIFQILFEWIRTGYNVPVLGRGDNVYQFVHADDLADACILAAARPGVATYNCGTDRFGTMREDAGTSLRPRPDRLAGQKRADGSGGGVDASSPARSASRRSARITR